MWHHNAHHTTHLLSLPLHHDCHSFRIIHQLNCPFFFKIGACRHGDRCSRIHHRPAFSQTILIKHIYRHPVREAELRAAAEGRGVDTVDPRRDVDGDKAMEDFLCFFEE